jgi:class 3 adenylate cyclase
LDGSDHLPWVGDQDAILDEVEEFLTGVRQGPEVDRVLATVLFTDIVGSTERAAEIGDQGWRHLLESYYNVVRRELARFRGREVDTAGTVSSRPSMDRHEAFGVPVRLGMRCRGWG